MYIYRLKEITPFVIGVKSYGIYIYITDKYYAVSNWRKIFKYIYTTPTEPNYAVSFWCKIFQVENVPAELNFVCVALIRHRSSMR